VLAALQNGAKEVKVVTAGSEYQVWVNSDIDTYIDSIGDAIEEIYGSDFDYKNRGDRIDIFPVK